MLLLLLSKNDMQTMMINQAEMSEIETYINLYSNVNNPEEAKAFLSEIIHDGFTEETKNKGRNQEHLTKLKRLKSKIINFYLQSLDENKEKNPEIKHNCDAHGRIVSYVIQLIRYRMAIQPEIQLTTNVHKKTKIAYLTVKGFWLNEDGIKERKYSRSLGRADEYPLGKEDSKAIEDATLKMQSILLDEYRRRYPEV